MPLPESFETFVLNSNMLVIYLDLVQLWPEWTLLLGLCLFKYDGNREDARLVACCAADA